MPMTKSVEDAVRDQLPRTLGIATLAHFLVCDYKTVWRQIRSGKLHAKKMLGQWTLRIDDVVDWLKDNWN